MFLVLCECVAVETCLKSGNTLIQIQIKIWIKIESIHFFGLRLRVWTRYREIYTLSFRFLKFWEIKLYLICNVEAAMVKIILRQHQRLSFVFGFPKFFLRMRSRLMWRSLVRHLSLWQHQSRRQGRCRAQMTISIDQTQLKAALLTSCSSMNSTVIFDRLKRFQRFPLRF